MQGVVNTFVLPAPHEVGVALWDNAGLLSANLAPTAEEVGLGVLLALLCGFVVGVLIHLFAPLRRAVYPLAVGSQAIPDRGDRGAARVLVGVRDAARSWS